MSTESNAAGAAAAWAAPQFAMREGVRGARYGEVLLVSGRPLRLEATVYNTLGLNDCPDELWRALDAEAIKREYDARSVILNGPRYFLMDKIAITNPGDEVFTFGDLQMRRLATLPLSISDVRGDRKSYTEQAVNRTTVYVYAQGQEVYELEAPDGATYVMQSYSLTVDPNLTEADLPGLGARLRPPAGWRFRARKLDAEWILRVNGEARLVQDELENSYQRVTQ